VKRHAGVALLVAVASTNAGEILHTEVLHDDGRYTVAFDVRLAAAPDRIKQYLTNYEAYSSYFDSIRESAVLGRTPDGDLRVRLRVRSCVLFFCRTVNFVKDITEHADGSLTARIDPTASDFREATEHWHLFDEDGETHLQYRAELVPTFFVPPLIGPWLIKYKIREALESGALTLEALANE
jgi:hypothetical protein